MLDTPKLVCIHTYVLQHDLGEDALPLIEMLESPPLLPRKLRAVADLWWWWVPEMAFDRMLRNVDQRQKEKLGEHMTPD